MFWDDLNIILKVVRPLKYMHLAMSQRSTAAEYLFWHDHFEELISSFKIGQENHFPVAWISLVIVLFLSIFKYWQLVRVITEAALSLTRFSICTRWEDDMTSSRCASNIYSFYWLYCWLMKKYIVCYIILIVKPHMTFYTFLIIHKPFEILRLS